MSDARDTTHDDLLPLIEALVNGTIDDARFARLDAMLASDPWARAAYRRYMNLHAALGEVVGQQPHLSLKLPGDPAQVLALRPDDSTLGGERFTELLASLDATEDDPPQIVDLSAQIQAYDREAREARLAQRREARAQAAAYLRDVTLDAAKSAWLYAGLAATLAVAAAVWALLPSGPGPSYQPTAGPSPSAPPEPAPTAVATLTDIYGAQWAASKLAAGDTLYAGQRLTLTEGFAEITTNKGSVALLEAPASIELLDNSNAIRLHEGKLVGICETESSKGFLVRTPHMDVTDLGTRFGVDATQADATEVLVFEGQVMANHATPLPDSRPMILEADQAARAAAGSHVIAAIAPAPDRFAAIASDTGLDFASPGATIDTDLNATHWLIATSKSSAPLTYNGNTVACAVEKAGMMRVVAGGNAYGFIQYQAGGAGVGAPATASGAWTLSNLPAGRYDVAVAFSPRPGSGSIRYTVNDTEVVVDQSVVPAADAGPTFEHGLRVYKARTKIAFTRIASSVAVEEGGSITVTLDNADLPADRLVLMDSIAITLVPEAGLN